ncbi:hypothetical protein G6O46_23420, partial [Salmonella enterica subsp. enterica serovar Enteritidis]|uniref:hypothetical protein n=1 Tax=Salmonella enterica TaxID=28901 RepID=UPI0018C89FFF
LARMLRREFDVITAVDAADAIAKIAPDLHAVVTDHDLGPGKPTGRAVLAEVCRQAPQARRILISGEPQEMLAGEEDLWHAMLVKPVARDGLLGALRGLDSK